MFIAVQFSHEAFKPKPKPPKVLRQFCHPWLRKESASPVVHLADVFQCKNMNMANLEFQADKPADLYSSAA